MKEKGVILPIFSLPSKYGIGDFGNEAYEFIDILSNNGIQYWEILPINACKKLPYSPISFYALNEEYISLDKLKEKGLIENPKERESNNCVRYDNYKEKYYIEAFSNFQINEDFMEFGKLEEINQYAEYMSNLYGKDKNYYLFLQYTLYEQWINIKEYANSKNVKIIGDMPMYPAFESIETLYNMKYFQNDNGIFEFEAGTPPDFYSSTGQKWNTPVYNIQNLKEDNYEYLIKRFNLFLKLFDIVRIDHFRGYDSFYKIPINEIGSNGQYEDGLSYDFFNELFKNSSIKPNRFIVEDLGDIREETVILRDYYNFVGQKILQTSIDFENMKDSYTSNNNIMVMPGNHDTHTIKTWYESLSEYNKVKLQEFLEMNNCVDININWSIIKYCLKSNSKIVMVTVQDILGLDDSSRINVPGTEQEGNWSWKLQDFADLKNKLYYYGRIEYEEQ
jgi:4-alpha-glucanotransferase